MSEPRTRMIGIDGFLFLLTAAIVIVLALILRTWNPVQINVTVSYPGSTTPDIHPSPEAKP